MCSSDKTNNDVDTDTADPCSGNYYCDCYYYICENEYGYYLQLSNGNQEICLNSGETTEDCRNKFKQKYGSSCCGSDTTDSGDTGGDDYTDTGDNGYTDDEPYEPINDDDDWYLAAYEYIQECTSVGHSEEDCETWYFEY